jgi:hypothetical protein
MVKLYGHLTIPKNVINMRIVSKLLVFQIILILLFAVTAVGSEEEEVFEDFENYNAKYYGVIKSMPQGRKIGVWTVGERKIFVTKQSEIDESFGEAEEGAYVEVEGEYIDKTFIAYEIEVRRENQQNKVKNQE